MILKNMLSSKVLHNLKFVLKVSKSRKSFFILEHLKRQSWRDLGINSKYNSIISIINKGDLIEIVDFD